jgi:hypothetical protein
MGVQIPSSFSLMAPVTTETSNYPCHGLAKSPTAAAG